MIVRQFIGPPGPALASSATAEARRLEILPRHRRQRGAGSQDGGARSGITGWAVHAGARPNQAQAERQRHATRARAEVLRPFSQPGPWRHTVVARLARTLGLTIHVVRCASKANATRGELNDRERPVRPAPTHSTVGRNDNATTRKDNYLEPAYSIRAPHCVGSYDR